MTSCHVTEIATWPDGERDDVLILAASWESRCLGVSRILGNFSCKKILLAIYDGDSAQRETNIGELEKNLSGVGELKKLAALHSDPLSNVIEMVAAIRTLGLNHPPRVCIDVSTFTRKHLMQLLLGLDSEGYLTSCRFFHTEPHDYDTNDNGSMVEGVSNVQAIEAFAGWNAASKDSVLTIFLGYEGNRALALWELIEPNQTLVVIPDPPYRPEWKGRTEDQNRYLLSSIPRSNIHYSSATEVDDTERLLENILKSGSFSLPKYKYQIAPLGTKAQTIGLYKFWRSNRNFCTIMYASATRYKHERANPLIGKTWSLGTTESWGRIQAIYPNSIAHR